jgi:hypothetical protein
MHVAGPLRAPGSGRVDQGRQSRRSDRICPIPRRGHRRGSGRTGPSSSTFPPKFGPRPACRQEGFSSAQSISVASQTGPRRASTGRALMCPLPTRAPTSHSRARARNCGCPTIWRRHHGSRHGARVAGALAWSAESLSKALSAQGRARALGPMLPDSPTRGSISRPHQFKIETMHWLKLGIHICLSVKTHIFT